MRATRGGVLGACLIDAERGELAYAAVGNIGGRSSRARGPGILDHPGTIGTRLPLPIVRLQRSPWQPGSTLIQVSDGIRSAWSLEDHPRLLEHRPSVVAVGEGGRLRPGGSWCRRQEVARWGCRVRGVRARREGNPGWC